MPASNPFIPADLRLLLDSRPDPDAPFEFLKRMTVNGPRVQENNYDMYQLTAGARGRLPGDWAFDVYAQYGASSQWKQQTGNVSRSKVEELTFAPDGGASICGGFSPFGVGSVLPACGDYVAVDAGIEADVRQLIAEASARGAPLTLPAGDLRMAIGLQYRSDEYSYRADEALRSHPAGRSPRHRHRHRGRGRHRCRRPQHRCVRRGRDPAPGRPAGRRVARNRARIPSFRLRVRGRERRLEGGAAVSARDGRTPARVLPARSPCPVDLRVVLAGHTGRMVPLSTRAVRPLQLSSARVRMGRRSRHCASRRAYRRSCCRTSLGKRS